MAALSGVAGVTGSAADRRDPGRITSCPRLVLQAILYLFSLSTLPGRRPFEVGRNMADDDKERKYEPVVANRPNHQLPLLWLW